MSIFRPAPSRTSTRPWCGCGPRAACRRSGRVLTLVIMTDDGNAIEGAIEAGNSASREHPCRVIVLARGQKKAARAARRADPGRRRRGRVRRDRAARLRPARGRRAGRGHGHAAAPARRSGRRLVAERGARGAVRGRRRQAGAAAHHRRPLGEEPDEGVRAAARPPRGGRHRPHLDAAHAVAGAAGHGAGRAAARPCHHRGGRGRGGVAVDRPDGGLARGAAGRQGEALADGERAGPGRGAPGAARRQRRAGAPGRQGRQALASPASPTDWWRSPAARCATAWPRSCAASTPTRSTAPRSRASRRSAAAARRSAR